MRPAYFAIKADAMSVSFIRSSAISEGNTMVGNPSALFFAVRRPSV